MMNFEPKHWLLVLLMAVSAFLPATVQGQCTPDPNAPTFGVFPDTVPPACPGVAFDYTLTFAVPADTTVPGFPLVLAIDSVRLDDLLDMPPGLSYTCNPPTCAIPGGTAGCVRITGTPTSAGTFGVDLAATAFISGLVFPDTLEDTLIVVVGFEATAVVQDASCGGSDGTATFTFQGGTPPYSFAWGGGQTDSILTNLAPGSYTATVTDADGCSIDFTATVATTGGAGPDIDVAGSTVGWTGCAEDEGGFIQLAFTGGTAPFDFDWSNDSITQDLLAVPAGTYTVLVSDANGCVSDATFEIDAPDSLAASVSNQTDVSCFGAIDGIAEVSATGGVGPYTYTWNTSPVQTGPSVENLPAGTYTVTIEDNAFCSRTQDVTIGEPDALVGNLGALSETALGASDGKAWVEPTGGTPPYSLEWEDGSTGDSLLNLEPGMYTVSIVDANGCELMDSVEVSVFTHLAELPAAIDWLEVYPNPTENRFSVSLQLASPQAVSVQVRDLQGRVLAAAQADATTRFNQEINLGDAPTGVYIIGITAGEQTVYRRLMLQR